MSWNTSCFIYFFFFWLSRLKLHFVGFFLYKFNSSKSPRNCVIILNSAESSILINRKQRLFCCRETQMNSITQLCRARMLYESELPIIFLIIRNLFPSLSHVGSLAHAAMLPDSAADTLHVTTIVSGV